MKWLKKMFGFNVKKVAVKNMGGQMFTLADFLITKVIKASGVMFLHKQKIIWRTNEADKYKPDLIIYYDQIKSLNLKEGVISIESKDQTYKFKLDEAEFWYNKIKERI